MFASQAALVIANARRHRDEQRARSGLETLVNTTPVGVLVLDARTGNPASVNREARRIVSGLCAPGGSAEQLAGGADLPAGRRAGGVAGGVPPVPGADDRGDGAGRGDRAAGPGRAQRRHPGQLHAHPLGGWGGGVGGGDHAGPDAFGGPGAAAGRVPGHGEPRTQNSPGGHQGLGGHPAGGCRQTWTRRR